MIAAVPPGERVDVVVVGSGVAGLGAAIEAAQAGARVLVLEGESELGGASVMSGAGCCLVDTPLQRAWGIADSVELALADWSAIGGATADLDWARRYLEDSRRCVHDFCAGLGIEWVDLAQPEGNSVPRWHLPAGWGRGIVTTLTARAIELGVDVRCNSAVTGLQSRGGMVQGVTATVAGNRRSYPADSTVICTGGFAANRAMVLDAAPALAGLPRLLSGSAPTSVGSGRDLLASVGAQFCNLDHIWVYPVGTPDPADPAGQRGLGVRGITGDIWLNRDGERFHDETLRGGRSGTAALLAQPGQTAWTVFTAAETRDLLLIDNEYWATPAGPRPEAMARFWRESDHVWRGDTARELASAIGLPVDAVEEAVAAVDAAIDAGLPAEPQFGRSLVGVPRFAGPRLVALQLFPMAQKTFGGVRTDFDCRVLDESDTPIRGLFAAGEVAGMAGGGINGRAALEGTMFGPCLYSGRIAGAAAAGRPATSIV